MNIPSNFEKDDTVSFLLNGMVVVGVVSFVVRAGELYYVDRSDGTRFVASPEGNDMKLVNTRKP